MMGHSKQIVNIKQQQASELANASLRLRQLVEPGRRLIMHLSEGPGLCLFPIFI